MAHTRSGAVVLLGACLVSFLILSAEAKKCPADETQSLNDPNNLYDCPKDASCCFENGQPSCCQPKEMNEAVKDQMKLWGGLAAILLVIVIVVLTCRRDIEVCKEGTVCCPCCCKPPPSDDGQNEPIVSDNRARNMGPPDFTAPGAAAGSKPPPLYNDGRSTQGGHVHPPQHFQPGPPMCVMPLAGAAGPGGRAPQLPPAPMEPPKTAGFAAIMDDDDDDEFKF